MIDQAVSDMHFKLIGGYGWFPSPSGHGGTAEPPVLEPQSVQGIFDASYYADATAPMAPLLPSNVSALRVFLRRYDVQSVLVLPEGAAPAAVADYVTAAIGPPVTTGGLKAWFHVSQRLLSAHSHPGSVALGNGGIPSHFVAQMANPAEGARISGPQILDAKTRASYFGVNQVVFSLTGGLLDDYPIGTGQLNFAASLRATRSLARPILTWSVPWNSTNVPNGTYRLQCVASDAGGDTSRCPSITISIQN
jgi:hypothetical protein